jgi:formylglycine-generating enzyme required for sulfatase activity
MANCRQGEVPWQNLKLDGFEGASPVGSFPPNAYGIYDMTGNVWDSTTDFFTPRHADDVEKPCCVPRNPRVASSEESFAERETIPRRVIKGGCRTPHVDPPPSAAGADRPCQPPTPQINQCVPHRLRSGFHRPSPSSPHASRFDEAPAPS